MYLMIRNPGIMDYRAIGLIGASTSRHSSSNDTVGTFGSGSKLSIALLLRHNIRPVITAGNLKMEIFSKPEYMKGITFNRVCLKYSGKDEDGVSRSSTEDLGFTLEWGEADWTNIRMAIREFVTNAIDGSIDEGGSYKDVVLDVVDKPRAKAGCTNIYIPYTPEVEACYKELGKMFLHFGAPHLLKEKILPKVNPSEDKVLVYKKGVLVAELHGKSVFDYNLGHELKLDESRNANSWDVQYSVGMCLRRSSSEILAKLMTKVFRDENLFEAKLSSSYLTPSYYDNEEVVASIKKNFAAAFEKVAGSKGVATNGLSPLSTFIAAKGFVPCAINSASWYEALKECGVPTQNQVLSDTESEGKVISDASPDMLASLDKVWDVLTKLDLTNGKAKPECESFSSIMDGEHLTFGYYTHGSSKIHLHKDLTAGPLLDKVTLEECVHYVTGSADGSRDLQDFLFRMIVALCFE